MAENREKGMLGAFRAALPRTLPVLAGYLVLGVAFGLLLNSIGLGAVLGGGHEYSGAMPARPSSWRSA